MNIVLRGIMVSNDFNYVEQQKDSLRIDDFNWEDNLEETKVFVEHVNNYNNQKVNVVFIVEKNFVEDVKKDKNQDDLIYWVKIS